MKPLIFKQITTDKRIQRSSIYVFGICIYSEESTIEPESPRRQIGFNVFPQYAPEYVEDEDYYPEECKHGKEAK